MLQGIDKKYNDYVQRNNKAFNQMKFEQMKHAQEQCVCLYVEKMDALEIDQHPVEDLTEKHASIREEALNKLKDLDGVDSQVLQNLEKVGRYVN
jgi:hypothetical protein